MITIQFIHILFFYSGWPHRHKVLLIAFNGVFFKPRSSADCVGLKMRYTLTHTVGLLGLHFLLNCMIMLFLQR